MDYLCQGNFQGVFGSDRDAYLAISDRGLELVGDLYLEEPQAQYEVRGNCEQNSDGYADFWFTLNSNTQAYRGTIYRADDGFIYIEGEQESSGIRFVMQRE